MVDESSRQKEWWERKVKKRERGREGEEGMGGRENWAEEAATVGRGSDRRTDRDRGTDGRTECRQTQRQRPAAEGVQPRWPWAQRGKLRLGTGRHRPTNLRLLLHHQQQQPLSPLCPHHLPRSLARCLPTSPPCHSPLLPDRRLAVSPPRHHLPLSESPRLGEGLGWLTSALSALADSPPTAVIEN